MFLHISRVLSDHKENNNYDNALNVSRRSKVNRRKEVNWICYNMPAIK